jgi:hypothetical protein
MTKIARVIRRNKRRRAEAKKQALQRLIKPKISVDNG